MELRNKLIAALIVPLVLACNEAGGGHNDFPDTSKPDPTFTLMTHVEPEYGPYVVTVHIAGGLGNYPEKIPVASGDWSHELNYKADAKLAISLSITDAKKGSKGWCKIKDGAHEYQRWLEGQQSIVCQYTTKQ